MGPLGIYISAITLLLGVSIAVWIWRHNVTRKCHLCGAAVELGRRRCQACGYEFIN